jgi:hypothetical protein
LRRIETAISEEEQRFRQEMWRPDPQWHARLAKLAETAGDDWAKRTHEAFESRDRMWQAWEARDGFEVFRNWLMYQAKRPKLGAVSEKKPSSE